MSGIRAATSRLWWQTHTMEDDREHGRAVADESGLTVPSKPGSVALARRYAEDACAALGWSESTDVVVLLVSELVTQRAAARVRP